MGVYWETNWDKALYILDISENSGLVSISIRFFYCLVKKNPDWTDTWTERFMYTVYQLSTENSQIKQECYNISLQTIQWKLKYNLARFELKFHWKYNLHVRVFIYILQS